MPIYKDDPELKALVYEALNNAKDNGEDELFTMYNLGIAEDLCECDTYLEMYEPEELVKYVAQWREDNPL